MKKEAILSISSICSVRDYKECILEHMLERTGGL